MTNNKKSSNLKTEISIEDVRNFVITKLQGNGKTFRQLTEGHISQAFYYEDAEGNSCVLRISSQEQGFLGDQYAYSRFGATNLPIPKVYEVSNFDNNSFYCVSEFFKGIPSDKLDPQQMRSSLDAQLNCFHEIYDLDISNTKGWGEVDINTGNGTYKTWKDSITHCIDSLDEELLKKGLEELGLDVTLFDDFRCQFDNSIASLSNPKRRLLHGDLGFDNLLVEDNKVSAVLDWASLEYGDWVFEYSGFDFWWKNRYPSVIEFGERFDLDCENAEERIRCSTARAALTTLEFAVTKESNSTKKWLKENLQSKLEKDS